MNGERRSALAAKRSYDVLALLASNPRQSYTMSELSKRLDISTSSMHELLLAMTQAGMVKRHPTHRTYQLGLMAAVVGKVARDQNPEIDLAQREASRIADEYGLRSSVVAMIDGYRVTVSRDGPLLSANLDHDYVGQRGLHGPPHGSIFAAWADESTVNRWLSTHTRPLSEAEIGLYMEVLSVVRREERAIMVRAADREQLVFASTTSDHNPGNGLLLPLRDEAEFRPSYVGVPTFDAHGQVTFGLFITDFGDDWGGRSLEELAAKLQAATRKVMAAIGGRAPAAGGRLVG